ncbi:MAG: glycosyltransferase, partial [Desulfobulbaceae bacterium]|nr:glycosyltransferase [Desulfobulbaceae bacterium]
AAGLPLVASDVPGCREVVRPDVNGFLVPPKDPESLARALNILLQDREMRRRMGRASREIAVNEFSEEQVVDATLSLYEELLLV